MTTTTNRPPAPPNSLPADRVGCIVWWSASVIQVNPDELRAALPAEIGKLVRQPVEVRSAMRRAMRRRQGAAMADGWRWEEVSDDAAGLRVALAQSERDAAAQEFRARTRFTVLVEDNGAVSTSRMPYPGDETAAFAALVQRWQVERGFLTAEDVRDLLVRLLLKDGNGTRQKAGGAVYFVPAPSDEIVDRVSDAFALAGVRLIRFPVDASGGAQLRDGAQDGIHEEIDAVAQEARERLRSVVEDSKTARFDTLAARLAQVEALRSKARLYEHILGCEMDAARAALTDTEAVVRETIRAIAARAKSA
jgi:hypothetical protein